MKASEETVVRAALDEGLKQEVLAYYRAQCTRAIVPGCDALDIALEVRQRLLDELGLNPLNGKP